MGDCKTKPGRRFPSFKLPTVKAQIPIPIPAIDGCTRLVELPTAFAACQATKIAALVEKALKGINNIYQLATSPLLAAAVLAHRRAEEKACYDDLKDLLNGN